MILSLSLTRRVIVLGLCGLWSSHALAWGPLGHHVVATFAAQQLEPGARLEIQRLLALEPGATLASISTWADENRDKATARWHYVNLPRASCDYVETRDCPGGDCVVRAIDEQLAVLKSAAADGKRLEALKYVVHLVADLHQPLHAGFADDRGGNQYQVNLNGKGSNLHALWDLDLVSHAGAGLEQWMQKLAKARSPALNSAVDLAQVARESCELVSAKGFYPPHKVPDEYLDRQAATVTSRLQLAGLRLASLLNGVWR
ncbi:MAG: S1/P1 nuclease [Betaproteobacteria bacterium]|nr:S1/P1 nuclease [Betaproteobacteria bacterium]